MRSECAMGVQWACNGCAQLVPCMQSVCNGRAMGVQWVCTACAMRAVSVQWACNGRAREHRECIVGNVLPCAPTHTRVQGTVCTRQLLHVCCTHTLVSNAQHTACARSCVRVQQQQCLQSTAACSQRRVCKHVRAHNGCATLAALAQHASTLRPVCTTRV